MKAFPSQEALSGVIGAIYDCALDPDGWEATLELVRRLLRACNAQLGLVDLTGKRILLAKSVGIEPCWLERQAVYHAELATWQSLPQALLRSPDEPLVSSRDLPEPPRVYRRVKHSKDELYDEETIHPRLSS